MFVDLVQKEVRNVSPDHKMPRCRHVSSLFSVLIILVTPLFSEVPRVLLTRQVPRVLFTRQASRVLLTRQLSQREAIMRNLVSRTLLTHVVAPGVRSYHVYYTQQKQIVRRDSVIVTTNLVISGQIIMSCEYDIINGRLFVTEVYLLSYCTKAIFQLTNSITLLNLIIFITIII